MTTARVQVDRDRRIAAPVDHVWGQISDVDGLVHTMQSMRGYDHVGDDRYHFTMKTYSALGYRVSPAATVRVRWHPPDRITFEPTDEALERAHATGGIELEPIDDAVTTARIHLDLTVELPIPSLLGPPAAAMMRHELGAGFDRFLDRLRTRAGHSPG